MCKEPKRCMRSEFSHNSQTDGPASGFSFKSIVFMMQLDCTIYYKIAEEALDKCRLPSMSFSNVIKQHFLFLIASKTNVQT